LDILSEKKIKPENPAQAVAAYSFLLIMLIGLYFTTRVNYLLFHSLSEIFSIIVAFSIFVIAWNSKKYISNPYLLFIGIAYLFVAVLDLMHTLSYKGMPIFTDYDYYANQLWIGARYMESITLLLAFIFLDKNRMPRPNVVFAMYTVITALIIASVFYWRDFPICFIAGSGLTPFKKDSEYIICTILLMVIFLLWKNRQRFERKIFHLLLWSMICTIISELAFTFYVSNYGFSNLVGHYFKIFAFFLIYQAIIKTGVERPLELIFLDLDKVNKDLKEEIGFRLQTQKEKEELIEELRKALDEIKTLRGIVPICSNCKKIRDDKGFWNQVEVYVQKHTEAKFSHGLCPDCVLELYPDLYLDDDDLEMED
jgi:Membrane-associated sensor domain